MPCPELSMTLCVGCDMSLALHMAVGGTPDDWPLLERERRAAVERAGLAARDRVRDGKANRPGCLDEAVRELARHGVAVIRERRRGVL